MMNNFTDFVLFCRGLNVDVATASRELLGVLEEKFSASRPAPSVPIVPAPAVARATATVTDSSNDRESNDHTPPTKVERFKDGWYDVYGRVTIPSGKSKKRLYKGVIKNIDLKVGGREKYPCFETHDTTNNRPAAHQDAYRRTSKMWLSDKKSSLFDGDPDKGVSGTYDTKNPIARAYVKWNSDNSIKEVSRFQMKEDLVGNTRKIQVVKPGKVKDIAPSPVPVPVPVPPGLVLVTSSIFLDKNDPTLVNDTLLKFLKYDPNLDLKSLSQYQKILGRIGEIGFGRMNPNWIWANTPVDVCDFFDYKHNQKFTTVDLKSIFDAGHNLMIEKSKVDLNRMADVFGLMLVSESGSQLEIKALGFITKEQVLEYIKIVPSCLMPPTFNVYKIEKWHLSSQLEIV